MLSTLLLLGLPALGMAADTLKGVVHCMNDEECLGDGRECFFPMHEVVNASGRYRMPYTLEGACTCREGWRQQRDSVACVRKAESVREASHVRRDDSHNQVAPVEVRETCQRDEDCRLGEVCMTWQYDPGTDTSRKLRSGLSSTRGERHQLCIDAWVIQHHMAELDEPRTGGGLRSHRRDNFNADEYFFGGRRPPRVHQQYIGFAEDMMLILFLVCILATLVTVHRATCYRQFQEARRNTPLRHLLPIAEDRPPPYSHTRGDDSVDGIPEVVCSSSLPKRVSETPPPSYEEALYRNSVRLPAHQMEQLTSQAVEINMEEGPAPSPPPSTPAPPAHPAPDTQPPSQLETEPGASLPSLTSLSPLSSLPSLSPLGPSTSTSSTEQEQETAKKHEHMQELQEPEQEHGQEQELKQDENQEEEDDEEEQAEEEQALAVVAVGPMTKSTCSVVTLPGNGPVIPV